MANSTHNNDSARKEQSTGRIGFPKTWTGIISMIVAGCTLVTIASIIVLSVIPLYLSQKGTDWPTNTNKDRTITMGFATTYVSSTGSSITNLDSLSEQINQKMNYQSNILSVQSGSLGAVGNRRKRQASASISCGSVVNGSISSTSSGSAMSLGITVNRCPREKCATDHCVENCLAEIKSNLTSIFGSSSVSLTIQTADGKIVSISCTLCAFGPIVAPSCYDGIQNGKETDKDCGGATCDAQNKTCSSGMLCSVNLDCTSGVCTSGVCQGNTSIVSVVPTCVDGVKNGLETDKDCGGATCDAQNKTCSSGMLCSVGSDCTSGVCTSGVCQVVSVVPTCVDGVKNGLETDKDCGGTMCDAQNKTCSSGMLCSVNLDCTSTVCTSGVCQAPTCVDGVKNGLETDKDCGGTTCDAQNKTCSRGMFCSVNLDCATGDCTSYLCRLWTLISNMTTARYAHTAVVLNSGQVLVAGGQDASSVILNSVELYNPTTGTWTAANTNMTTARYLHTAVVLNNGQVLVAGGIGASGNLNSVELYNPTTGTWTAANTQMTTVRQQHTAVVLNNGQVLVAGGIDASHMSTNSVELYNPTTGTWTAANTGMTIARYGHTAVVLNNGQVLVADGQGPSGNVNSVELYNPTTGTWTAANANMTIARFSHTAVVLNNGQVLVAGGQDPSGIFNSVEIY